MILDARALRTVCAIFFVFGRRHVLLTSFRSFPLSHTRTKFGNSRDAQTNKKPWGKNYCFDFDLDVVWLKFSGCHDLN